MSSIPDDSADAEKHWHALVELHRQYYTLLQSFSRVPDANLWIEKGMRGGDGNEKWVARSVLALAPAELSQPYVKDLLWLLISPRLRNQGENLLRRLPKDFVAAQLEEFLGPWVDDLENWEWGLLLQSTDKIDPCTADKLATRGLTSSDADVREECQDFLSKRQGNDES
jgi:hypothetical protein